MLHELEVYLGTYLAGILTGVVLVRYGIGLGSRLHVRAKQGLPLDKQVEEKTIDQEFTK